MRLHLVSFFFAPLGRADGVNRTFLSRYLAELGWSIDVITCENRQSFLQSMTEDRTLLAQLEGVDVRIKAQWAVPWRGLGELLFMARVIPCPFVNWAWPCAWRARTLVDRPDVIYAIVPPYSNAVVAGALAEAAPRARLVLDFRDNCDDLPASLVERVDAVIVATESTGEDMIARYGFEPSRVHVIYGGYPDAAPAHGPPERDRSVGDRLRIVFTGSLSPIQDPFVLDRAIGICARRRPGVERRFDVRYYGPKNYYVRAGAFRLRHGRFMGYVPFEEAQRAVQEADVAFTSLRGDKYAFAIPSKVFGYMRNGTPLLAHSPRGALSSLIDSTRIGWWSDAASGPEGLAEQLLALVDDREAVDEARGRVRVAAPSFAMRYQAERLSAILEALV